jgi:hypothetical protein
LVTAVLAAPWHVRAGRAASPPGIDVSWDHPALIEAMLAMKGTP